MVPKTRSMKKINTTKESFARMMEKYINSILAKKQKFTPLVIRGFRKSSIFVFTTNFDDVSIRSKFQNFIANYLKIILA